MKAAVTVAPGAMEIQEIESPVPVDGEVLVAVDAVGLCGSDFHLYDGHHPYAHFPQVQGHEIVGHIVEVGPGCNGSVTTGDRVVIEPLVACGVCFACRHGRYNCCIKLEVMGAHIPGGLREYMTVSVDRVYPVGDMPILVAVLAEPLAVGLQSVTRGAVGSGDSVVVIGAGPIGQAATLGAVDRGARVLVVDRIPSRLALAEQLGAECVVDSGNLDVDRSITEFTGGDGAAVVIEATGVPELVSTALEAVAYSGTVVVVGISDQEVSIPVGLFSRKEINLFGSRNNAGLFPEAIALGEKYADRISALITHTYPLCRSPEAIEYAMHHPHEVEKAVILLGGEGI